MPARVLPLVTLLLVAPSLFGGCQAAPDASVADSSGGARAQALARLSSERNRFAGDWGPGPGYVANDWLVRFSKDGRVSVRGPGMTARGTYVASGDLAHTAYAARDGGRVPEELMHGEFSLSRDGEELTFSTGLPDDPPVHLRRMR